MKIKRMEKAQFEELHKVDTEKILELITDLTKVSKDDRLMLDERITLTTTIIAYFTFKLLNVLVFSFNVTF